MLKLIGRGDGQVHVDVSNTEHVEADIIIESTSEQVTLAYLLWPPTLSILINY